MNSNTLIGSAAENNRSRAQMALRWLRQQSVKVIPFGQRNAIPVVEQPPTSKMEAELLTAKQISVLEAVLGAFVRGQR